MLLTPTGIKNLFARHFLIGFLSTFLVFLFVLIRSDLPLEVRLARGLGDSAFVFLSLALAVGPLSKIWKTFGGLVSWRRELGIWFAVLALAHFLRVSSYALFEPGIELPRFLGLVALFWALVLAATSSDYAVNFLGPSSWKWLHSMAYVIFYLVVGHAAYFLFWRYPVVNFFQYPFLVVVPMIPVLQISAFFKEVVRQRAESEKVQIKKMKLPIVKQKLVAKGTVEVSFGLKEKFEFLAGQYVRISVPKLLYEDSKGTYRLFSIVSSPNDKKKLSIAFRDSGSGFKKTLMELRIGSLVNVEGPFGHFTLPKDTSDPLVFIAGGIGITPFISMIRFINENKLSYKVTLLYSNKSPETAAYLKELTRMSNKNKNFSVINKFGRIDSEFITENVSDLKKPKWYIVGPPNMVSDMRNLLIGLGVEESNIYFEEFTGY